MPFEKKGTLKLRCGHLIKSFRQNNDFFRLTLIPFWISYGVVRFCVFANNRKFFYNCKKVMQVLKGQYPQFYVKKFRVFYTDFQPNATRRSTIPLFTLPKAHQIVSSFYYTESQFLDGAGSDISVALWDTDNQAGIGVVTGNFSNYRVSLPQSSTNGAALSVIARSKPTAPTTQQLFCGFTAPTPIGLSVTMPSGRSVNLLTSGTVVVWVGYIKLP